MKKNTSAPAKKARAKTPAVEAAASAPAVVVARPSSEVTPEMREILTVLLALKAGDFSVRLPSDWTGVYGKIADTLNDITALTAKLGDETARVSRAVA